MMNAETSAIGRALAALGIAVRKSLASANEVRNRVAEREPEPTREVDPRVDALVARLNALDPVSRKAAKGGFVQEFGRPTEVDINRLDEAGAFVDNWESGFYGSPMAVEA